MKTKEFPYRNVQEYLNATGVLETGSAEDIVKARKVFRKLYLKAYQKRYTQKYSSVNITFTYADKKVLKQLATENGKKLASFIKELAMRVANGNQYDTNKTTDLSEIKRLFSLCYDIVEHLQFENEYPALKSSYDKLEQLFYKIENLLNDY